MEVPDSSETHHSGDNLGDTNRGIAEGFALWY